MNLCIFDFSKTKDFDSEKSVEENFSKVRLIFTKDIKATQLPLFHEKLMAKEARIKEELGY